MEKLKLHEILRIYLPGLLLSFGLFLLISFNLDEVKPKNILSTISNLEVIIIPSIFVSFLLDAIIRDFFYEFKFKKIEMEPWDEKENFVEAWNHIIITKMKVYNKNDYTYLLNNDKVNEEKLEPVSFVTKSFFSKRFDLPELSYFRMPKSFGIMFFNLAVVSVFFMFISTLLLVYKLFLISSTFCLIFPFVLITLFLFIMYYFFLESSDYFFRASIKRELSYWKSLREHEINEIVELIRLWEKYQSVSEKSK